MEASPTFAQAVFDRTPPFSMEAETAVLGGILIDRDALVRAIEVVDETMFYREGNRRLFRAMVKLFERGDVIDVITVSEELKKTAEFDAVGGYDYMAGLVNAVPTAANVEYHARIVADKALLRRLVEQATHIIRDVYEQGDREVEELLDEAETRIFKVAESHDREGFSRIKDLLFSAIERIDARQESGGGLTGIPTGFPRLDDLTSGFQKGDLCIVAARPSMGKTSWVLNVMGNAAVHHDKAVAFFSLEMSREQLVERLLCSEGGIDLQKLRHRRLEFEENRRLAQAAGHLHNAHIWIDDSAAINVLEVRAKARRLQAELRREGDELALVAIDYLQLMSGHRHTDNRVQEVSDISRGLKALARELDVPVIALSQLSRATEQRPDRRPMLSDLRDSGAIEQDADVVMFLHRQDYYLIQQGKYDEANQVEGHTDLTVAKQRNGPTGSVPLLFRKAWTRFESRDDSKLGRSLEAEAGASGLLP